MKCPECNEEMEGEPVREVKYVANPGTTFGSDTKPKAHHNGELDVTVQHYRCANCDSEWTLRRGKLNCLDSGTSVRPLDQVIKPENYK